MSLRRRMRTGEDYSFSGEKRTRRRLVSCSASSRDATLGLAMGPRRIHDRASGPVFGTDFWFDFNERGELDGAGGDAVRAAGFERTSGRKLGDGRDGAFDSRKRKSAIGLKSRNRAQQALGIGMSGRVENVGLGAELDQVAGVHDGDAVGDVRNDGEIVRDEEHRQSEFVAEVVEQVEDLLLNGDIERGGGLVGNEQLRAVDDGHGDHDALAHASGELMRITAGALFGVGDGNVAHASDRLAPCFRFGDAVMSEDGFGDLVADTHDRVEGGHGLLENHGDARAAKLPQLVGRQLGEMRGDAVAVLEAVLENDFARDDRGGRKQAHDGERGDGFSGAGFADQAEHFARGDRERKTANGGHGCNGLRLLGGRRCQPSTGLRELDGQVTDVEQRAHQGYGISAETTSLAAIPAAPTRQRGNTLPTGHSVLPSAQ